MKYNHIMRTDVVVTQLIDKYVGQIPTIADVGCGTAIILSILPNAIKYTGVDPDQASLDEAMYYNPQHDFLEGSVEELLGNKYGIVLCLSVLDEIPLDKLPKFMEHLTNITKDILVLEVNNPHPNVSIVKNPYYLVLDKYLNVTHSMDRKLTLQEDDIPTILIYNKCS